MNNLPIPIAFFMKKWFLYPNDPLYCQLTTTIKNKPHIRTMTLFDLTDNGEFIFLCRTDTNKWEHMLENPHVAGCMSIPNQGQIIFEGIADLKTKVQDEELANYYWNNKMPDMVKRVVEDKPENIDIKVAPLNLGIIIIKPNFFDVLEMCVEEYIEGVRTLFHLKETKWQTSSARPS